MIELHRHLDASVRSQTLFELVQEKGLLTGDFEGVSFLNEFETKFLLRSPLPNLESVLSRFQLFQQVLDSESVLQRVAYECVEDCYQEGIQQVELRFSPGFISEKNGLNWDWILDAITTGIQNAKTQYPEIEVGLICIASRDMGLKEVDRTIDFFLETRKFWVGFDLAGPENDFPPSLFKSSFQKLKNSNVPVTIHAGEGTASENIWSAIFDLNARRIGHGIAAIQDPSLMDYLRDQQICLELCPTSNWITSVTPDLSKHPIRRFFDHGIPVSLNTDDPGIFGNTLSNEVEILRTKLGFSSGEIEQIWEMAKHARFL